MSHAVGPNSGHSPRAGNRTTKKPGAASIVDVVKVFLRLLPKQLKDEAQLAVLELKAKGIKLGIGAAFAVVGLIFLGLAVIALVGAAIAGLSHVMPAWLAALLLAVVFLVVLAILALIGVSKIKGALPLMPEKAVFGLRYDLGVVKEGSAYNEGRVQRDINEAEQKKQREKEEAANDPNRVKPVKPTEEQLRNRLKLRREHLKSLRDDTQNRVELRAVRHPGLRQPHLADVLLHPGIGQVHVRLEGRLPGRAPGGIHLHLGPAERALAAPGRGCRSGHRVPRVPAQAAEVDAPLAVPRNR